MSNTFSQRLLDWWDIHGRKDMPWQHNKTPYRVWLSEIMLQQTQVSTVIPYYLKFTQSYPTVSALAAASEDNVLQHWAGLGYYNRARNLHATAAIVASQYQGEFPQTVEELMTLPGIGESTAGAIAAFSMGQHQAILDGNVKRVLTRYRGIIEWPGTTAVIKRLWQVSRELTPKARCDDYNQAIMDLGASLCSRSKPKCDLCPMQADCYANRHQMTGKIPARKPKKKSPEKSCVQWLLQLPDGRIWLEKRPAAGVWPGLYSLPETANSQPPVPTEAKPEKLPAIRHVFSHFILNIQPLRLKLTSQQHTIQEQQGHWVQPQQALNELGLPAPVRNLLQQEINNP